MAKRRLQISDISPLEILGAFFGYFAVAKDVPDILKMLSIKALLCDSWKKKLLTLNPNANFWYLLFFTVVAIAVFFIFVVTQKEPKKDQNQDTFSTLDNDDYDLHASWKRIRRLSVLRSLGLNLVREWILTRLGVSLYGTFKRQSDWMPAPERFKYIDRINYEGAGGDEFQYAKNFKFVIVRTHPANNDTYGPAETRVPTFKECRTLLFASNFFPFWLLIHLLRRPFI